MKLIDRYILQTLLAPLAYMLTAFSMLYLIFDLFENMNYFMGAKTPAGMVAQYYLYRLPTVFIYVAPVSMLLSVLYTLFTLTRYSEFIAMQASGFSIQRLLLPIALVGVVASLAVLVINEVFAPRGHYWTYQYLKLQKKEGDVSIFQEKDLGYVNARDNRHWQLGEFDTRNFSMRNVRIIQSRADNTTVQIILAGRAVWLEGRWWLSDVTIKKFDPEGFPRPPDENKQLLELSDYRENPDDFLAIIKDPLSLNGLDFFSARDLSQYLQKNQLSPANARKLLATYHYRFAIPWACLISTLLGIPFGVKTARHGVFLGVLASIGIFILYYIVVNVSLWMGKTGIVPPVLAAWLPNLMGLTAAVILIRRMR